jgi:transposase-like protein
MVTDKDASIRPAQRVEVFTGTGRRRIWLDEEKVRIVAEIVSSGDSVCAVARRNGLSPQQLFGWRRRLRMPKLRLRKRVGWSSYPRLLMRIGLQSRHAVSCVRRPLLHRSRLRSAT